MREKIIVLDFGGQYTHLIANRIRRKNIWTEIWIPEDLDTEKIKKEPVKGIILSGGPQSVYDKNSPQCDKNIINLGIPILGICYGHQFLNHITNGNVSPGKDAGKEFGKAQLVHDEKCPLFDGIPEKSIFWMSHGDQVEVLGKGFEPCGKTENCPHAAIWNPQKNIFGIQFHPEVTHSEFGSQLLQNFINICDIKPNWNIDIFLKEKEASLKKIVNTKDIFLFISGGVDSSVCFALLSKIFGKNRIKGIFVDNGLLRKNEVEKVEASLKSIGTNLIILRTKDVFLEKLKNIADPETKRAIIGKTFLEVQKQCFKDYGLNDDNAILAQGTIYPDTIETGNTKHSSTIKTHHNRIPEIDLMIKEGRIIEPISDLYKDEVRSLGEHIGLPKDLVWRHPFPGPGLGVRILCSEESITWEKEQLEKKSHKDFYLCPLKSVGVQGDSRSYKNPGILKNYCLDKKTSLSNFENLATNLINENNNINRILLPIREPFSPEKIILNKAFLTPQRINLLQDIDDFVSHILTKEQLYREVWQFPVILTPLSTTKETFESIILRPINSIDAMSASIGHLPYSFFETVYEYIKENHPTISNVFLDITNKPPGTIEWE